jgi:subtilisin family serine protease
MNRFPEELNEPSRHKITIDKTRVLIALKESHTLEDVQARLLRAELVLESDIQKSSEIGREGQTELINHTDKRYWIRSHEGNPVSEESLNRLGEIFSGQLDWIAPVYQNPDQTGREGLFCPIPSVLVIKFTTSFSNKNSELSEIFSRFSMEEVIEKSKYLGEYHYFIIKNIENENAYQIKDILLNDSQFFSEVLYESMPMILPTSLLPNDTNIDDQWNMTRIRAGGEGTTAWDISTGINNVVICILDSGCDLTHPDLDFSTPGVHLDNNMPDGSPINPPIASNTNAGHGTACAGISAATINNGQGIAGTAGSCRIMPLAFRNWDNVELAGGINFASMNGAQVISMSFRFNGLTTAQQIVVNTAIQNAFNNDVIMCAATGNANINGIDYPARNPRIIACGASDQIDNRKSLTSPDGETWGSNFGQQISVVAPGVRIPTTDRQGTDGYNPNVPVVAGGYADTNYVQFFNGTSSATPHVAGLAALVRSLFPVLTNVQVRQRIERNTDKVGTVPYINTAGHPNGTWNQEMGYGRINTLKTLTEPRNLWIAWKGSGNDQLNAMSVFEPNKKIVLHETSDTSPALVAFRSSFWIAWKGSGNDQLNVMDVFNPNSKIVLDEESDTFPALTTFNDQLWIAWKGSGNDQLNVMDVFNPSSKTVLNETSDVSPSIASNVDLLRIAWKGSGNDQLNFMDNVFEPSSTIILSEESETSPSLTRFSEAFWLGWKGSGNDQLNAMNVHDPPSKVVLNEESSHSPSITEFNDDLWIAWKGSGNDELNVMDVFNPSSKRVLAESSDTSPSIASFNP